MADTDASEQSNAVLNAFSRLSMKQQQWLDAATPHTGLRWIFWICVAAGYLTRVFFLQVSGKTYEHDSKYLCLAKLCLGWYIVTYAIGIFILNQFIAFLTPKIDPAMRDYEEDGLSLPTKSTEEFRPFMRQLPELKFWYSSLKAILIGLLCTCFDFFNIPVFWPILVIYFIILFAVTMKKQIRHMIKYKYIPFTHGKTQYKGKADSGK